MARTRTQGDCHLCGTRSPLSFEHVPPRAAFNDLPVITRPFEDDFNLNSSTKRNGHISQRGMGAYTLCQSCNNKTGAWYARDFSAWCYQGMNVLIRTDYKPKLIYLHYTFPLRVLKQIYTMAFSSNSSGWRKLHPELEQFVLDPSRRWLNPKYRTFVYYNVEGTLRQAGNYMAMVKLDKGGDVIQVTETSFPPFGYVVTTNGTKPDTRLFEITHFRRYSYDEIEVAPLYLPVLPTHLPIPLDYRTREEIAEQAASSRRLQRSQRQNLQ
jgi:hypothetical protein